jgi:hypothetical protein
MFQLQIDYYSRRYRYLASLRIPKALF